MTTLSMGAWSILILAAALVGVSKTALPGAATLAVALFAAVLPAKQSTGTMLILLLVGDLLATWTYRHDVDWAMLRKLVPGVLAGVVAGALFLHFASDGDTKRVIGIILLALIAVTLLITRNPVRREQLASGRTGRISYGSLAGFTTMVANAGGPVTSMYFLASRLPVSTFLGTTAWFFFTVNLVKLPFSISLGIIAAESLRTTLPLVPIVLVSAFAGRSLVKHMSQRIFDPIIIVLTVVSAAYLLV